MHEIPRLASGKLVYLAAVSSRRFPSVLRVPHTSRRSRLYGLCHCGISTQQPSSAIGVLRDRQGLSAERLHGAQAELHGLLRSWHGYCTLLKIRPRPTREETSLETETFGLGTVGKEQEQQHYTPKQTQAMHGLRRVPLCPSEMDVEILVQPRKRLR
jgi:hypothetical protein